MKKKSDMGKVISFDERKRSMEAPFLRGSYEAYKRAKRQGRDAEAAAQKYWDLYGDKMLCELLGSLDIDELVRLAELDELNSEE